MKPIIESIKQRILSSTTIMDVRRFNNQISKVEAGGDTLFLPSVLLEFTDITYHHKDVNIQLGNCTMKVYVVSEEFNHEPDVNYELAESVHKALNNYSDGINFHPLERSDEYIDDNYSNIVIHIIHYNMAFCDYLQKEEVSKVVVDLQLNVGSSTIDIPLVLEAPKIINPNTNDVLYLSNGDVYEVPLVVHEPSTVINPNTNETITLNDGDSYTVPTIQDELNLVLTFPVESDDTITITFNPETAASYTSHTLTNVSSVTYTVVSGDKVGISITRTTASSEAQVIIKNN
jgi:hypothetical protein